MAKICNGVYVPKPGNYESECGDGYTLGVCVRVSTCIPGISDGDDLNSALNALYKIIESQGRIIRSQREEIEDLYLKYNMIINDKT